MLFLVFSIANFLIYFSAIPAQEQFFVGAIFKPFENEAEIIFRNALERAKVVEEKIELIPIVAYADTDDSFVVEKTVCNLISQGVIAIFGPNSASSSDIVAAVCLTLEIPHIMYDWRPYESLIERSYSSMTLNLYPEGSWLATAYADIVHDFNWRSFTVIYESKKELHQLQYVLEMTNPGGTPTTIRQLTESTDHRPILKDIKFSFDNCIVLHCKIETVVDILRQAKELNMLGTYQSIFIPTFDTHTINWTEFENVNANITFVRIMNPKDYLVKNVAIDWEAYEKSKGRYHRITAEQIKTLTILANDAVVMFAKGLAEFHSKIEKLTPPTLNCESSRPWSLGRKIIEFLRKRSTEAATGRIDFDEYGERNFFTLRLMEFSPPNLFYDLATWDPVKGLVLLFDDVEGDRRIAKKLANRTLIITARIGAPFLIEREPEEGEILEGNARYEGYSLDLIDMICKSLDLKYEFRLAPDNEYGSYDQKTKSWNGLLKQLLDGNADLGICDLTMTSTRRQYVDFTPPFMTLGISILYAKPEMPPPDLFSFLSPFTMQVWLYIATSYLIATFLFYGLSRFAPAEWEEPFPNKEPYELVSVWKLMNTAWVGIGSLVSAGSIFFPKSPSMRMLIGVWWFLAFMMNKLYTANLSAFLTKSRMVTTIKSAEDLAKQAKIKYGALLGGSTMAFFQNSNVSTYQKMWHFMEESRPSVFTKSNDEGADRVIKEKGMYAFLMESTSLEYIIERKCELIQIGGWLDYKTYGIAMPFNSPYRKQISAAILRLGEKGTLAELKRKWWKEMYGGGKCLQSSVTSSTGTPELKMENVGGVFLVLGIGLVCSMLIGLALFVWNVKEVVLEERITFREAFKLETTFAYKFWISNKPVRKRSKAKYAKEVNHQKT